MREKKWVRVYKFFEGLQGEELGAILKENNISARIISRSDSAFDGIFKPSIGEGIIEVMEDYVEQAKRIIADYEKQKGQQSRLEDNSG